jgi:hypothetical protein
MPKAQTKALANHRRKLKRKGVQRLELSVHKDDVAILRGIAAALSDPTRMVEARALLRSRFGGPATADLKAYLASAPLEGIDLKRSRDLGRKVEL